LKQAYFGATPACLPQRRRLPTSMGPAEAYSRDRTWSAPGQPAARVPVKIALLLPLGGMGETAAIAKGMKQGAEMALFEVNDPGAAHHQGRRGTAAGVPRRRRGHQGRRRGHRRAAALQSVTGVAPVARQVGVPVPAFSNDTQVAGHGVYLMSFLADQEVERIVSFAAAQGKRRFAALIPDNAYGNVVEPAFRRAVQRNGGVVAIVERYPPTANGMLGPAKRVVEAIKNGEELLAPVDALFLPGGQEALPQIGPVIAYSGPTPPRSSCGTSAWDFGDQPRRGFIGGWYPSPDPMAWRTFAERFAKTFGNAPPRIASVAYDAVGVAIGCRRTRLAPASRRPT
jgi:ABC-type branched-subunit amino acid transport system substrate-binding protein